MRENREGRAHYAADGSFADTREMLGKDAAVREFGGVTGPGDSQAPAFFGSLRAGGSDFADGDLEERFKMPVNYANVLGAEEKLHGDRRRASPLIASAVNDNKSSQFAR